MQRFTILLILTFLLNGCSSKDTTETIIDNHIGHIDSILEYAYNNFEQTQEVMFLENELESCQITLKNIKESHNDKISVLEHDVNYWRVIAYLLMFLMGIVVVNNFKKVL